MEKTCFCPKCDEKYLNVKSNLNENYIFIDWASVSLTNTNRSVQLCQIPANIALTHKNLNYKVQGVMEIIGEGILASDVGHFIAYCKRPHEKWEIYDDLQDKVNTNCPPEKVLRGCALLVYRCL
ncbi:hypothetical protein TcasGA2_TC004087 [Tribolium castaneum]|uniref:USP domain-containing protein n=1 Tax=Tribolium castaneum TaxID=7070 RepID=D7ELU3_TRICA|nr:hypothetical protein TcasGA2_TC004087 [Tribolium castaneum]